MELEAGTQGLLALLQSYELIEAIQKKVSYLCVDKSFIIDFYASFRDFAHKLMLVSIAREILYQSLS